MNQEITNAKLHGLTELLGINSEKRTDLNTMSDYKKLFDEYEKTTLIENKDQLQKILDSTHKYQRIAITCFEKEPCMCHSWTCNTQYCSYPL